MISVASYGHTLDSSVTSCGHPPRVSVPLIARILKKKLKVRTKKNIFHNFHHAHPVPESFLRHICQDKSSCDSPFKDAFQVHSFMAPCNPARLLIL